MSLHLAGARGSGGIALQLYLPEEWAHDAQRCAAVGVPRSVRFARKWQVALNQLEQALVWGVRRHVVFTHALCRPGPPTVEHLATG